MSAKKQDFIAGRDLAVAMLQKVRACDLQLCDLSSQFRDGQPQAQPLATTFAKLRASPELEEGFLGVLTDYLAHTINGMKLEPFAELTYEQMRGSYRWPADDEEPAATLALLSEDDPDAYETANRCTTPQLIEHINKLNETIGKRCWYVQNLCAIGADSASDPERVQVLLEAIRDTGQKTDALDYELREAYEALIGRLQGGAA